MFGVIRFVIWTGAAIALGVFLAGYEIDGKTPLQHAEKAFKQHKPSGRLDEVKDGIEGAIADARKHVASKDAPVEHHSDADKDAVNALLAKRSSK